MTNISLQDLVNDPAGLIDRVEAGERVLVMREGRAVAELRPITSPDPPRVPTAWQPEHFVFRMTSTLLFPTAF